MKVQIDDEAGQGILDPQEIRDLVGSVLRGEGLPEDYEVSVSFVDARAIQDLNRDYRGIDRPTDVLSFVIDDPSDLDEDDSWELLPADADEDGADEDGADEEDEGGQGPLLGDVIICPQVVLDQAPGYGNSAADEMRLLLVHGCLHLMGYDHETPEEAEEMEALERSYLAALADVPVEQINVGPTVDHVAEGSAARPAGYGPRTAGTGTRPAEGEGPR